MDDALRNGLWNILTIDYWDNMKTKLGLVDEGWESGRLIHKIWHSYFKLTIDNYRSQSWGAILSRLRDFFMTCEWNEVYDFIEFVCKNYSSSSITRLSREKCNSLLKRELSAYRFVNEEIVEITSEEEIAEIEQALQATKSPIKHHLDSALTKLADRKKPDYRNSIKESISAVEAMCKLISGDSKATLGQALKVIEDKGKIKLHAALKDAFKKLYGYTSNAQGIRHSLLDEPTLDFEDAKFMLVSCSGFINYLKIKASKAGISL